MQRVFRFSSGGDGEVNLKASGGRHPDDGVVVYGIMSVERNEEM